MKPLSTSNLMRTAANSHHLLDTFRFRKEGNPACLIVDQRHLSMRTAIVLCRVAHQLREGCIRPSVQVNLSRMRTPQYPLTLGSSEFP